MTDSTERAMRHRTTDERRFAFRFRPVQLMPAPATLLALAFAATHGITGVPLVIIAGVGALATVASASVPASDSRRRDDSNR
jgi:hypothetical protein